ncbi:DUF1833 family protein [Microbulbifer sp. CnH-101-E]|uniref:DUF1833 family protein n=1 Tax=unclassified Microbulbifer TaxID=2619833 RepID=UPI00403992F8
MSAVLETVYASAPIDQIILHTLELKHPAFEAGAIRLCQGFDDIEAKLEDGQTVIFTASGFGVSLPQRSMRGRQDLQFQLDNVTGEALQNIDIALEVGGLIQVAYRQFLESDLSAPAQPPTVMTAVSVKANARSVSVIASFHDLVNKAWPNKFYTPDFAPGLKYYG